MDKRISEMKFTLKTPEMFRLMERLLPKEVRDDFEITFMAHSTAFGDNYEATLRRRKPKEKNDESLR